MTKFLENRGFQKVGSNGQPKAHYKLPFRIQNWKKEVGKSDIDLLYIIADDKDHSGYVLYRSTSDDWTDGIYVKKTEAKEVFDKVVNYLMSAPANSDSNMYGSSSKEGYEAMYDGSFGIPASDVV